MSSPNLVIKGINEADLPSTGTDGEIYVTEQKNVYVVKNDGSLMKLSDILVVSALPTANIYTNKIYILTTVSPWTLNAYDGSAWQTLGGNNASQWLEVTSLPTSNIDSTKLYFLTSDSSVNIYDSTSSTWKKFGQADVTEIDGVKVNGKSTIGKGKLLGYNDTTGNVEYMDINVTGIVGSTGIQQPSGSKMTFNSLEEKTFNHPSATDDKIMINILEQVAGTTKNDTTVDFSQASKYNIQTNNNNIFVNNKVELIDPYTKLLMHMDTSGFTDVCGNTITNGGAVTLDTSNQKFGTGAAIFNATANSYFSIPYNPIFNFGTNDWTVDFWMKYSGTRVSNYQSVINTYNDWAAGTLSIQIDTIDHPKQIAFANYTATSLLSNILTFDNTWMHIALVMHNQVATFYINGIKNVSVNCTGNYNWCYNNMNFFIGKKGNWIFNGELDEFRISNIARWTSNFTPPTAPSDYPNTNSYYVSTTGQADYSLSTIQQINSLTIPITTPTNTSVKCLFSVDNQTNWLYKDGTGIHKFTGTMTSDWSTTSNSNTELQTYFANLTITQLATDLTSLGITPITLDFAFQLLSTDGLNTPTVSPITLNYLSSPHSEFASFGRYDESSLTFGVKRVSDTVLAVKNLTTSSRTAQVNIVIGS